MYTSDINRIQKSAIRTALLYLAASILCAMFGAVYEAFSHDVYSYFMIYAFLFPLIGGALPFFLLNYAADLYASGSEGITQSTNTNQYMSRESLTKHYTSSRKQNFFYPVRLARNLYHSGILALTLGSILTGILEIYGTTNPLIAVYWFVGAGLIIAGIAAHFISLGIGARMHKS